MWKIFSKAEENRLFTILMTNLLLDKKWSFPSAVSCGFGHIYWKTSFFAQLQLFYQKLFVKNFRMDSQTFKELFSWVAFLDYLLELILADITSFFELLALGWCSYFLQNNFCRYHFLQRHATLVKEFPDGVVAFFLVTLFRVGFFIRS